MTSPNSPTSSGSNNGSNEPRCINVRSQYTYASFIRSSTGALEIKVNKQKIKVGGSCYEVQEIYGLESKSSSTNDDTSGGGSGSNDSNGGDGTNNDTTNTDISSPVETNSTSDALQTQECVVCMTNPRKRMFSTSV
jgi:hypothetical protein